MRSAWVLGVFFDHGVCMGMAGCVGLLSETNSTDIFGDQASSFTYPVLDDANAYPLLPIFLNQIEERVGLSHFELFLSP